ncbi:hypothetical protein [Streptomyces sp. NPDC127197]|uniref:SCO2400 family protein n=1 Tax=Streptomyces sp. NPDC127197 TaxID=3345388 RepID=UPI0036260B83
MDYWRMDYCSSCRRHLNGALVCPGCGAYAPDIAPDPAGTAPTDPPPETVPPAETDGAIPAPQGRAARRHQRARWKKSRRKAVIATAVALVGGGLTLAAMDRHSGDGAQAATAQDEVSLGAAERPTAERDRPSTAPPETPRSSPTAPASDPARQRPGAPRTTPESTRADAPVMPHPTGPTTQTESVVPSLPLVPQQRADSPASGATPPATTAPTSDPADSGGTDPGTTPSTPAPAPTSPSSPDSPDSPSSPELCLLVICLGG